MIKVERIYKSRTGTGRGEYRILVDRLWPRGVKKDEIRIDLWMKEIAPSNDLRKWFMHDPSRWEEFKKKYFGELLNKKDLVESIVHESEKHSVILLYGAKDEEYNNAVALKEYIMRFLEGGI